MDKKKLVVQLLKTTASIEEKFNTSLKPLGLSLPQFNVLRILRGHKGAPANLFTLQERMIKPMSNTTRLVDKLIEKGWVRREVCAKNRRKVEIYITEQGLTELKTIDNVVARIEKEIAQKLSLDQQEEFYQFLNTLHFKKE
jgi:MarR family 2-MHQ and catechol resistance regulon transcriptional repressor